MGLECVFSIDPTCVADKACWPKMDLVEIPEDLPEGEYLCLDLKTAITTIMALAF